MLLRGAFGASSATLRRRAKGSFCAGDRGAEGAPLTGRLLRPLPPPALRPGATASPLHPSYVSGSHYRLVYSITLKKLFRWL